MAYRVYFSTMKHIEDYERYLEDKKQAKRENRELKEIPVLEPACIKKDNKIVSYNKHEIDLTTAFYKDEEELVKVLKENPQILELRDPKNNKLLIVSKSRHTVNKTDAFGNQYQEVKYFKKFKPIYNSSVLYVCAKDVKRKHDNGKRITDIELDDSEELSTFIDKIKDYIRDNTCAKQIANLFKYKEYFKNAILNYNFHINEPETSIDAQQAINESINTIAKNMHQYSVVRTLVQWEKGYLKSLEAGKTNDGADEEFKQLEFDIMRDKEDEIKDVAETGGKTELLNTFSLEELKIMPLSFLNKYDIDIEKLMRKKEKEDIKTVKKHENDKIYNLASEGKTRNEKLANIIEHMDLDELASYPGVVLADAGTIPDGLGLDENGEPIKNGRSR